MTGNQSFCTNPAVTNQEQCVGSFDIAAQDFQCWIEEDLFRGLPQCPPQNAPDNTFWSNAMEVSLELQDVVLIFDFVAKISEFKFLSLRMDQIRYPSCWLSTLADRCGETYTKKPPLVAAVKRLSLELGKIQAGIDCELGTQGT
jgi:hypothetical protein